MKKSRKIALFGILCPLVLMLVLSLILLAVIILSRFFEWGLPTYHFFIAPVLGLLFPLLTLVYMGGCIAYAVLSLRQSRRDWTGYLAVVGALVPVLFMVFSMVMTFIKIKDVIKSMEEAQAVSSSQLEESLQNPPDKNNIVLYFL